MNVASRNAHSVRNLPSNIFAIVMATGIVSIGLHDAGFPMPAIVLFWLNVLLYAVLTVLIFVRVLRFPGEFAADFASHARAPGFFTLTAAPCILGNQCILLCDAAKVGLALWIVGLGFWLALSYVMVPGLMQGAAKPKSEDGVNGAWLLAVVATQAISLLACRLAHAWAAGNVDVLLFVSLIYWLVGSMLYIWLIALIFHRILFLPLLPSDLTPPYWINMGAMAISTLAGVRLVAESDHNRLLGELTPFLEGMTLLFWATATWWIPVLFALGILRHLYKRFPLAYEHGYWAAVFPLGMYTVCTQDIAGVFRLPFLSPISTAFVWIAVAAWALTFAGMCHQLARKR